MKIIQLETINFLDWKGILLCDSKPSVEATEENLKKLATFIQNGMLKVKDPNEVEEVKEDPYEARTPYMQPVVNPFLDGSYDLSTPAELAPTNVVREEEEETVAEEVVVEEKPDYSRMKKSDIEKLAQERGIVFDEKASKKDLIKLLEEQVG